MAARVRRAAWLAWLLMLLGFWLTVEGALDFAAVVIFNTLIEPFVIYLVTVFDARSVHAKSLLSVNRRLEFVLMLYWALLDRRKSPGTYMERRVLKTC